MIEASGEFSIFGKTPKEAPSKPSEFNFEGFEGSSELSKPDFEGFEGAGLGKFSKIRVFGSHFSQREEFMTASRTGGD
jgi:hypothetical protein